MKNLGRRQNVWWFYALGNSLGFLNIANTRNARCFNLIVDNIVRTFTICFDLFLAEAWETPSRLLKTGSLSESPHLQSLSLEEACGKHRTEFKGVELDFVE
jgi:hypothetical protein